MRGFMPKNQSVKISFPVPDREQLEWLLLKHMSLTSMFVLVCEDGGLYNMRCVQ